MGRKPRSTARRWRPRWPGPEKVLPIVLSGFLGLWLLTIIVTLPGRPRALIGTVRECVPARDLGMKRYTSWFDCTVVLPGTASPVTALSRRPRVGEVQLVATRHPALGTVTYLIVE